MLQQQQRFFEPELNPVLQEDNLNDEGYPNPRTSNKTNKKLLANELD